MHYGLVYISFKEQSKANELQVLALNEEKERAKAILEFDFMFNRVQELEQKVESFNVAINDINQLLLQFETLIEKDSKIILSNRMRILEELIEKYYTQILFINRYFALNTFLIDQFLKINFEELKVQRDYMVHSIIYFASTYRQRQDLFDKILEIYKSRILFEGNALMVSNLMFRNLIEKLKDVNYSD